ncbi:hypothetical protein RKD48_000637 [Streptomyces ambofaciens]
MAELVGGVAAVTAVREMFAHVRQQGAAPANRDVEQPAVEAALLARRELPVGVQTTLAEFLTRLFESGRRGVGVHPQQTGRDGYGLAFDLRVPQQTTGWSRKRGESPGGQRAVFRGQGLRRPHAPSAGGFEQLRHGTGYRVVGGPLADRVAHGHQQARAQRGGRFDLGEPGQHPVPGRGGDHAGDLGRGGETDGCVVVRRLPVAGHEQRGDPGRLALRSVPEPRGQQLVGLPGVPARGRVGGPRGVGGGH